MTERYIGYIPTCCWCETPIHQHGYGRPRKYCSHSCRQRAYENRKTERVHDWLEYREYELDYYRRLLTNLQQDLEPVIYGYQHTMLKAREVYELAWATADPYTRYLNGNRCPMPPHRLRRRGRPKRRLRK